jgi:hypothetical protein
MQPERNKPLSLSATRPRVLVTGLIGILLLAMVVFAVSAMSTSYFELTYGFGEKNSALTYASQEVGLQVHISEDWILWPTFAVFLFWIYTSYSRLRQSVPELRYSSAEAVAVFLIPIINFWQPLAVLRELWRASERMELLPVPWQAMPAPTIVRLWWIFWGLSLALHPLGWQVLRYRRFLSGDQWSTIDTVWLCGDFALTGLALLSAVIVRKVSRAGLETRA